MPEVDIINCNNEKVGKMSLDERVFAEKVNKTLIHETITMQMASLRQGTACAKTRSEVRGGGKKPWKQKGTGRARSGSIRSPLWRGGGTIFGPRPRDYSYSYPKKKSKGTLCSILSDKVNSGEFIILDEINIAQPKTKLLNDIINKLELKGKSILLIEKADKNLELAARNMPDLKILHIKNMNPYELIIYKNVIIQKNEIGKIVEVLS